VKVGQGTCMENWAEKRCDGLQTDHTWDNRGESVSSTDIQAFPYKQSIEKSSAKKIL
jgi:hypothetical protein